MFGGPRDSAWTHIRVEGGSREDARAFLPAARLLLGKVKETAATSKIGVLQVRQKLADGGELVGRIVGAIPHVTIKLPRFPPKEDDRVVLDGFVCWPRNAANPDGAGDAETDTFDYPQMVLSPPSARAKQRKWWTFLYERFSGFWQAIRGSKEVYKTRGAVDLLPAGLRVYGNHHWRSRSGVVLSWNGPESGAIVNGVEAFIFLNDDPAQVFDYPQAFYGSKVYHFGRELLDVTAFPTSRIYVGGACFRKTPDGQTWLYVAQWEGADEATFFRAFSVFRYRVGQGTPRPGFLEPTIDTVAPETRELVFSATLPTTAPDFGRAWHHPVRFNQSGTELTLYVPAGEPFESGSFTSGSVLFKTAAYRERDARITYEVDTGNPTITYLQLATNTLGSAAIAGDYRDDELVEIRVETATPYLGSVGPGFAYDAGSYVLGEQRIPIATQAAGTGAATRRDIVALAPADDRALLLRTDLQQPPGESARACTLELWGANGLIASWSLGTFDGSTFGVSNLGAEVSTSFRNYADRPIDAFTVRKGSQPYGFDGAADTFPASAVIAPITSVATPLPTVAPEISITRKHAETIFNPYPAAGYQPFTGFTHRIRFTTNARTSVLSGSFLYTPANGGFAGNLPDTQKKLSTRALVRHEAYTLVSCARPGTADETVVRLVPDGRADFLTGLDDTGLRLHPASLFGTPVFRTA